VVRSSVISSTSAVRNVRCMRLEVFIGLLVSLLNWPNLPDLILQMIGGTASKRSSHCPHAASDFPLALPSERKSCVSAQSNPLATPPELLPVAKCFIRAKGAGGRENTDSELVAIFQRLAMHGRGPGVSSLSNRSKVLINWSPQRFRGPTNCGTVNAFTSDRG
jgi:hypothetical protein